MRHGHGQVRVQVTIWTNAGICSRDGSAGKFRQRVWAVAVGFLKHELLIPRVHNLLDISGMHPATELLVKEIM
jgi:hypothetical protein